MDLPTGLIPDVRWNRFIDLLSNTWDMEARVEVLGVRHSADADSTVHLRFKASLATEQVRVHVQHDGSGGGGLTYDPSTFVSSNNVPCFTDRQQDVQIARNGTDNYAVWLIPLVRHGDGSLVPYDGLDGRPDHMAFELMVIGGGGGGTNVVANPSGGPFATDLTALRIGSTDYNIAGGGGGGTPVTPAVLTVPLSAVGTLTFTGDTWVEVGNFAEADIGINEGAFTTTSPAADRRRVVFPKAMRAEIKCNYNWEQTTTGRGSLGARLVVIRGGVETQLPPQTWTYLRGIAGDSERGGVAIEWVYDFETGDELAVYATSHDDNETVSIVGGAGSSLVITEVVQAVGGGGMGGGGTADGVVNRIAFDDSVKGQVSLSAERTGGLATLTDSFAVFDGEYSSLLNAPPIPGNPEIDARINALVPRADNQALFAVNSLSGGWNDRHSWAPHDIADYLVNLAAGGDDAHRRVFVPDPGTNPVDLFLGTDGMTHTVWKRVPGTFTYPDATTGFLRPATADDVGTPALDHNNLRVGESIVTHQATTLSVTYRDLNTTDLPNFRGTFFLPRDVGNPQDGDIMFAYNDHQWYSYVASGLHWVAAQPAGIRWRGVAATEDDADRRVFAVGDVVYIENHRPRHVRIVSAYTAASPEQVSYQWGIPPEIKALLAREQLPDTMGRSEGLSVVTAAGGGYTLMNVMGGGGGTPPPENRLVPSGGSVGFYLGKTGAGDYQTGWLNVNTAITQEGIYDVIRNMLTTPAAGKTVITPNDTAHILTFTSSDPFTFDEDAPLGNITLQDDDLLLVGDQSASFANRRATFVQAANYFQPRIQEDGASRVNAAKTLNFSGDISVTGTFNSGSAEMNVDIDAKLRSHMMQNAGTADTTHRVISWNPNVPNEFRYTSFETLRDNFTEPWARPFTPGVLIPESKLPTIPTNLLPAPVDITGKADTDLQNILATLTEPQQFTVRTRIGAIGVYDDELEHLVEDIIHEQRVKMTYEVASGATDPADDHQNHRIIGNVYEAKVGLILNQWSMWKNVNVPNSGTLARPWFALVERRGAAPNYTYHGRIQYPQSGDPDAIAWIRDISDSIPSFRTWHYETEDTPEARIDCKFNVPQSIAPGSFFAVGVVWYRAHPANPNTVAPYLRSTTKDENDHVGLSSFPFDIMDWKARVSLGNTVTQSGFNIDIDANSNDTQLGSGDALAADPAFRTEIDYALEEGYGLLSIQQNSVEQYVGFPVINFTGAGVTVTGNQVDIPGGGMGGGTTVVANPGGTGLPNLSSITIGAQSYQIPMGGGGGAPFVINTLPNLSSGQIADHDVLAIEDSSQAWTQHSITFGELAARLADGTTITSAGGTLSAVGGGGGMAATGEVLLATTTGVAYTPNAGTVLGHSFSRALADADDDRLMVITTTWQNSNSSHDQVGSWTIRAGDFRLLEDQAAVTPTTLDGMMAFYFSRPGNTALNAFAEGRWMFWRGTDAGGNTSIFYAVGGRQNAAVMNDLTLTVRLMPQGATMGGGAAPFDLFDDVTTAGNVRGDSRFVFADLGVAGNPNRYIEAGGLLDDFFQIAQTRTQPTNIQPNDQFLMWDVGGAQVREVEFSLIQAQLNIGGGGGDNTLQVLTESLNQDGTDDLALVTPNAGTANQQDYMLIYDRSLGGLRATGLGDLAAQISANPFAGTTFYTADVAPGDAVLFRDISLGVTHSLSMEHLYGQMFTIAGLHQTAPAADDRIALWDVSSGILRHVRWDQFNQGGGGGLDQAAVDARILDQLPTPSAGQATIHQAGQTVEGATWETRFGWTPQRLQTQIATWASNGGGTLNGYVIPNGGADGQVLGKASAANRDTEWVTLAAVARSGDYNDLLNRPTIPTDTNNYVTGGSVAGTTLTLTRQGLGDVTITGLPSGGGGVALVVNTLPNLASGDVAGHDVLLIEDQSDSWTQKHLTFGALAAKLAGTGLSSADGVLSVTGGMGGGDDAYDWATEGNTDRIPENKMTGIPTSFIGQSWNATDTRLTLGINRSGGLSAITRDIDIPARYQIPSGGADGRLLGKASAADYDYEWIDANTYIKDFARAGSTARVSAQDILEVGSIQGNLVMEGSLHYSDLLSINDYRAPISFLAYVGTGGTDVQLQYYNRTEFFETLAPTGTPGATTYLRGDGQWATPAGGGGGTDTNNYVTGGSVSGTTLTLNRLGLADVSITGLPAGGGGTPAASEEIYAATQLGGGEIITELTLTVDVEDGNTWAILLSDSATTNDSVAYLITDDLLDMTQTYAAAPGETSAGGIACIVASPNNVGFQHDSVKVWRSDEANKVWLKHSGRNATRTVRIVQHPRGSGSGGGGSYDDDDVRDYLNALTDYGGGKILTAVFGNQNPEWVESWWAGEAGTGNADYEAGQHVVANGRVYIAVDNVSGINADGIVQAARGVHANDAHNNAFRLVEGFNDNLESLTAVADADYIGVVDASDGFALKRIAFSDFMTAVGGGGSGISQTEADARYLRLTGGMLTGAVSGVAATADAHLTTRGYADTRYLQLTGGTLTGALMIEQDSNTTALTIERQTGAGNTALQVIDDGDARAWIQIDRDLGGSDFTPGIALGPGGTSARDVNLYRGGAETLKTDDTFDAADYTQAGEDSFLTFDHDTTLDFEGGSLGVSVNEITEQLQESVSYFTDPPYNVSGRGSSVGHVYETSPYSKTVYRVKARIDAPAANSTYRIRIYSVQSNNQIIAKLGESHQITAHGSALNTFDFESGGVTIPASQRTAVLISRTGAGDNASAGVETGGESSNSPRESYDDASNDFINRGWVEFRENNPGTGDGTEHHDTDGNADIYGNIEIYYRVTYHHGALVGDGTVDESHINSENAAGASEFLVSTTNDRAEWRDIVAGDVPSLPASRITSGTFNQARIPGLPATRITSGTFSTARIPNLAASKITSGEFNIDRLPDQAKGRTSLWDGTGGTWTNTSIASPNVLSITVSDIDDYEYITISLWADDNTNRRNIRTVSIPRSMIPEDSTPENAIPSSLDIWTQYSSGSGARIAVGRDDAGTTLYFQAGSGSLDNGAILGVWGGSS